MDRLSYKDVTEYIENIPMFGPNIEGRNKSGNDNLSYVMEKLGHPEKNIKAVHIAGTNGKGSTTQFTADILCALGYAVGLFTSPHLLRINERISMMVPKDYADVARSAETDDQTKDLSVKRMDITDDEFVECFCVVREAVDESVREGRLHLSYFEFLFAMAAVYFDSKKPDYVIYETGLGGRLDATNILAPVITAITSIGLEHTKYLGNTVRDIAWEKAGIIKEGVPVVYNTGDNEADMVICAQAEMRHAEAINVAKTEYIINEFTDKTIDFSVYNRYYKYNNLILGAGGAAYQVDNAMTAITICNAMKLNSGIVLQEDLQHALDLFVWPGRMERIHPNIVLDGAHNPDAIARFIDSVNQGYDNFGKHLLFAVAEDKDYEPMIKQLCEGLTFTEVYVTSIDSSRRISSEYIAGLFRMYLARNPDGKNVQVYHDDNIRNAFLQGFHAVRGTQDIMFCVGSLYLVGSLERIASEVLGI